MHKSYPPTPLPYRKNLVTSTIPEEQRKELELLAKKLGISMSRLVNIGVVHMLARYKNNKAYAEILNKDAKGK